MDKTTRRVAAWCLAIMKTFAASNLSPATAQAQGTAFTYQGWLNASGSPANGSYDLRFALYDSSDQPGKLLAGPVTNSAVMVSNGLFSTLVDLGNAYAGTSNWLELAVSPSGANAFAALAPREQLTPMPHALFANSTSNLLGGVSASQLSGSLPAAQISGTLSPTQLPAGVLTNGASGVSLSGTFGGNGSGLTSLDTSNLTGILPLATLPGSVMTSFYTLPWLSPGTETNYFLITNSPNPDCNLVVYYSAGLSTNGVIVWTNTAADGTNVYLAWNDPNVDFYLGNSGYSISTKNPADVDHNNFYVNGGSQNDTAGNYTNLFGPVWENYFGTAIALQVYSAAAELIVSNSEYVFDGLAFNGSFNGSFTGNGVNLSNVPANTLTGVLSNSVLPQGTQSKTLWLIEGDSYTSDIFTYGGCTSVVNRTNSYMWYLYTNYTTVGAVSYYNNAYPGRPASIFAQEYQNVLHPMATSWPGPKYYFVMGGYNDINGYGANSNTVFGYLTNAIALANADGCITVLGIQLDGYASNPTNPYATGTNWVNWVNLCSMLRTLTNNLPTQPRYIVDTAAHWYEYNYLCDGIHPDGYANISIASLYNEVLSGVLGNHISEYGGGGGNIGGAMPIKGTTVFDTPNVVMSQLTTRNILLQQGGTITGNGSSLTNLPASSITGTLGLAQLPGPVVTNSANGVTLSGVFAGDGSGLTSLHASNLIGTISAANFLCTVVTNFPDAAGPLPVSFEFTSHGGRLLISTSGSGSASTQSLIGMVVSLDGTILGTNKIYASTASGHLAFIPKTFVVTGQAAAAHTLSLSALPNLSYTTTTDDNDTFCVTVQELPY